MSNYGIKEHQYEVISGSAYLFPSGALSNPLFAISASVPQIIAISCSSNVNNRLTKLNHIQAFATITVTSGSSPQNKDTKFILRYISGSSIKQLDEDAELTYSPDTSKIFSSSEDTINQVLGGINTNISYIDIPLLNNDDAFAVAYKTANAFSGSVGNNIYYSASLLDDGSGITVSSSLGDNMSIGSSFKIRNSSSSINVEGAFLIHSINSGSVVVPDFSGTQVEVGTGMEVGDTFMVGGGSGSALFSYNVVRSGSGALNQPFYEGKKILPNATLGLQLDPNDKLSGMITGSGQTKLYFSGSGKIGFGTTNPERDFDVRADDFGIRKKAIMAGIRMNEDGNLESFNNDTNSAATGSEMILKYTRGTVNDNSGPSSVTDAFSTKENVTIGDTLGSIRWIVDSGSLDERGGGEAGSIKIKAAGVSEEGITGEMLFGVARSTTAGSTEIMKLSADGTVHITGSLAVQNQLSFHSKIISASVLYSSGSNIFGDAKEDTHTFTGPLIAINSITSSANISSSGTITGNAFVGTTFTGMLVGAFSGSAQIDHDSTTNFVANEHIDHSSVSVTAGTGLTGGGTIAANRTLNVIGGTGVTANANDIAIGQDVATTAKVLFAQVTASSDISSSGTITAAAFVGDGSGLSDITTSLPSGVVSGSAQINELITDTIAATIVAEIDNDEIPIAKLAEDAVTVTSGTNLSGGGAITLGGSITLNVDDAFIKNDADDATTGILTTAGLKSTTNITSSGNISASGNVIANSFIGTFVGAFSGSAQIDHDSTTNFVANEHIDHSAVSVVAGTGLTGGGTIAANRTLNVIGGTGVTANDNDIAIGQDVATTADVLFNHITASGHISTSGTGTFSQITTPGRIYATLGAGTDNSVVVNSSGQLVTDEIDAGVWGGAGAVVTAGGEIIAPTATLSSTSTLVATTDDEEFFVTLADGASGAQALETSTKLKQNPSTGKLTITGDISSSGTITSLSSSIEGPIRGKQLQVYHANWKDNSGTTEHFIPLAGVPDENVSGVKEQTAIIMPCAGTIKEIILRMHWSSAITTSDDITWKIYNRVAAKKMNGQDELSSFDMTNPTQGGSDANNTRSSGTLNQAFAEGDAIMISMQWARVGPTHTADRMYVTVVVENDWNTVSY